MYSIQPLELQIIKWSQYLIHTTLTCNYPCTYRTDELVLLQMYKIRVNTSLCLVGLSAYTFVKLI